MSNATCTLCPFDCDLPEGKIGKCRVRGNVAGKIELLTYGLVTTAEVGPIEQKPFYHYHPGMKVLSIGGSGCNMFCGYCQNWEISQVRKNAENSTKLMPEDVVAMAKAKGARGVTFTYSEPFVWYEYVMDVAIAAREAGLKTLLKTNAYAEPKAFAAMCDLMDAVNIDFKGSERLYKDVCGIELDLYGVLAENVHTAWSKCHLELSTLAIPGYMDKKEWKRVLYAMNISNHSVAIHILKFIPDFKMVNLRSPTDDELREYQFIAQDHFRYVYVDFAMWQNDTICECGHVLIKRKGIEMQGTDYVETLDDKPNGGLHSAASCPKCKRKHSIKQ